MLKNEFTVGGGRDGWSLRRPHEFFVHGQSHSACGRALRQPAIPLQELNLVAACTRWTEKQWSLPTCFKDADVQVAHNRAGDGLHTAAWRATSAQLVRCQMIGALGQRWEEKSQGESGTTGAIPHTRWHLWRCRHGRSYFVPPVSKHRPVTDDTIKSRICGGDVPVL